MNCDTCKHSRKAPADKPDFVQCGLRLPAWVAASSDNLSGMKYVLKMDHCSFYEHRNKQLVAA
jgi:hypothetical protein